jgi:hypothetical protein
MSEQLTEVPVIRLPLLWLDDNAQNEESAAMRTIFNMNFGRCKFYSSVQECQNFIRSTGADVVLVVSGQLGSELVPQIHDRRNVSKIYIYCQNVRKHRAWSASHTKVYLFDG